MIKILEEAECLQPELICHVKGALKSLNKFADRVVDWLKIEMPTSYLLWQVCSLWLMSHLRAKAKVTVCLLT